MEVRRLKQEEINQFYEVFSTVLREGFPEYSPQLVEVLLVKDFPKSFFEKEVLNNSLFFLVAAEDNQAKGFLIGEKLSGGVGYCNFLGVVKECRGKGIGRNLLQKWAEEVIKAGGHKLLLATHSEKNRGFYKKCGFDEEGFERKSWYGLDCWVFGKVIAEPRPVSLN